MRYCDNDTANTILHIYAEKAKNQNIDFTFKVALDDKTALTPTDITVLLSNLLENALNGCLNSQKEQQEIFVLVQNKHNKLSFVCHNTCRDNICFDKNGLPQNPNREGIGTLSIMAVAKKYNGDVLFNAENGRFTVQAYLINN